MTYSLDTSVIVRLLIGDDPTQLDRAAQLLNRETAVTIAGVAIVEATYALQHHYGMTRATISEAWRILATLDVIDVPRATLTRALDNWMAHPKLSFADCWLAAECERTNQILVTFDRKQATQLAATELL